MTEQYPQPGGEGARFRKRQEMSVELECACLEGRSGAQRRTCRGRHG
jgi:hypothetical protein